MKYLKIIIPVTFLIFVLFIYNDSNPSMNSYQTTVNNDTNNNEPKYDNDTNVDEKLPQKLKKYSNSEHVKQIEYTKVALPAEVREIDNTLTDIQNGISIDKDKLDFDSKQVLANSDMTDEINKAEELIAKLNKDLNIPQKKIDELDNSYLVIMNTPITAPKSLILDKKIKNMDKDILKLEEQSEKILNGDIK